MGLDMYLTREVGLSSWRNLDGESIYDEPIIPASRQVMAFTVFDADDGRDGLKPFDQLIPEMGINSITQEVLYWRKANHIHNWFVQEVADGVDECQRITVSERQLRDLVTLCELVVNSPTSVALLPTKSGFFFGATDYDEYYFEECKRTAETLRRILPDDTAEDDGWGSTWTTWIYQASW